jgi:hypothetical protein
VVKLEALNAIAAVRKDVEQIEYDARFSASRCVGTGELSLICRAIDDLAGVVATIVEENARG